MRTRLHLDPLEDRLTPAAGDLDPTFGMNGVTTIPFDAPFDGIVRVAAGPDGHVFVLVAGGIARFEPNGDPDPTFAGGGVAPLPGSFDIGSGALAGLPDGGVVVAATDSTTRTVINVTRFNNTGVPDAGFATNGTAAVGFDLPTGSASSASPAAVTLLPDGRLLIAGAVSRNTTNSSGAKTTIGSMAVARLTAAGQLDPSFDGDGRATVAFPVGALDLAAANSVAVMADGRIVLGGSAATTTFETSHPSVSGGGIIFYSDPRPSPAVVRLTSDGQLDPTFGSGGRVLVTLPGVAENYGYFTTTAVLPDGRIQLAGTTAGSTGSFVAVRLTAAGGLDPSYVSGGVVLTGGLAPAVALPTGQVVFGNVTRLGPDGKSDAGFGANGTANTSSLPGNPDTGTVLEAMAVQPNGDIVFGAKVGGASSTTKRVLVRLLGNNPAGGFVPATPGVIAAGGAADGSFAVLGRTSAGYATAGVTAAFPGFAGSVRTATADVTGDGTPDYVVGAGPGGPPQILVIDGKTGLPAANFMAFEAAFTGGVFVAAADLDRDGKAEVIVTPDQGGGPRVLVFSVAPGGGTVTRASFFGIDDANFRGGARAALGDIDHDGVPDLVVAAGFLGGPRVAVFGGASLFTSPTRLVSDFFAFPGTDAATLRNGAFVAVGDVTGDGFADLVFGGGPGGGPRVLVLSGATVLAGNVAGAQAAPVANYFVAGDSTDRGGIRVAVADADGDARADVVTGSGAGRPARVRVYRATGFGVAGEPAADELAPFGGATLPDGVYVG